MDTAIGFRLADLFRWPDSGTPQARWAWTLVGATAVPLWAMWPALAVLGQGLPPFQFLAMAFAVGWLLLVAVGRSSTPAETAAAGRTEPRWLTILVCAVGLTGTNAFFVLAVQTISAAQANLISYLWPIMLVLIGAALRLFALRWRHALALALGFAGAGLVIGAGDEPVVWTGVALAALSGLCWAGFSLYRLRQGPAAGDVLAEGCGLSALLCLALHLGLESATLPSWLGLLAALGVGIAPLSLANLAWDRGIRRGDGRTLAVMAYATPLLAAVILVLLGLSVPTWTLFAGGVLITLAGALSAGRR